MASASGGVGAAADASLMSSSSEDVSDVGHGPIHGIDDLIAEDLAGERSSLPVQLVLQVVLGTGEVASESSVVTTSPVFGEGLGTINTTPACQLHRASHSELREDRQELIGILEVTEMGKGLRYRGS